MQADEASRQLGEIRAWMREGRGVMVESWRLQLWWGALTAAVLVATWWVVRVEAWGALSLLWPLALTVGWTGSVMIARLAPTRARNQATRAVEGIWLGAGATLTLVGLVGYFGGAVAPAALPGIVAAVLGGAYWATDRVTEIGWLRVVAVVWWAGAALLLVVPSDEALLVLAVMALLFEAGPALVLARREKAS